MKTILFPEKETLISLCLRPELKKSDLVDVVRDIINSVKSDGDKALFHFSEKFDMVSLNDLKVSSTEISESIDKVPGDLKTAINFAKSNIEKFHASQLRTEKIIETCKGV
jgi:histidinol dehydrogenase